MERKLLTLQPAMQGWKLFDQDTLDYWYPDKLAAVLAADCISLARYKQTGMPTGVKVQMACGDWVMMAMHG